MRRTMLALLVASLGVLLPQAAESVVPLADEIAQAGPDVHV